MNSLFFLSGHKLDRCDEDRKGRVSIVFWISQLFRNLSSFISRSVSADGNEVNKIELDAKVKIISQDSEKKTGMFL